MVSKRNACSKLFNNLISNDLNNKMSKVSIFFLLSSIQTKYRKFKEQHIRNVLTLLTLLTKQENL
jgi:hypothetical protein